MARVPLPPIPTQCTDVELGGRPRRDSPVATIRPGGTPGEVHRRPDTDDDARWAVHGGDAAPERFRAVGAGLVQAVGADLRAEQAAGKRAVRTVWLRVPGSLAPDTVGALAMGILLGSYDYRVSTEDNKPTLRTVRLVVEPDAADPDEGDVHAASTDAANTDGANTDGANTDGANTDGANTDAASANGGWDEALRRARRLAAATILARDLANTPSNVKDPQWLAGTAERLLGDVRDLHVTVRAEEWLTRQRFGGVLAVGGGSASAPRLIEATYRPRGATTHLLLVGKGITFDTGGLSIKPAAGMHLMRTDMAGSAAVLAAIRAIATLRLPVRVTALVPAAENHVSGGAYRPGDVVRHYGGRTSEVSNTDAEGRMVLADALAYGTRRFDPDVVVDAATLTGAMKVALGLRTGGVFATDDDLARRVRDAGDASGEAWWRMPLLDAHADAVRSGTADVRQAPEGPGGIVAALFLREFTGGLPWAHLDIAGPARAESNYGEVVPGATGFAARTLVELAASYS